MIKQTGNVYHPSSAYSSVDEPLLDLSPLQAGLIKDSNTLQQAQHLLYYCYVEIMKWHIEQDNCSGIRIDRTSPAFRLTDDYDKTAHWFSVKQNNTVLACARLCSEDALGKLELERYPEAIGILGPNLLELKEKFRILEFNREAVNPHCTMKNTIRSLLLKAVFQYCLFNRYAIITTTHIQEWTTFYDRIAFPTLKDYRFKYASTDPEMATVYFATQDHIGEMHDKLCVFLNKKGEST